MEGQQFTATRAILGLTQQEAGDGAHLAIAVMLAIEASSGNVSIPRWPRMDLSAPADKVKQSASRSRAARAGDS